MSFWKDCIKVRPPWVWNNKCDFCTPSDILQFLRHTHSHTPISCCVPHSSSSFPPCRPNPSLSYDSAVTCLTPAHASVCVFSKVGRARENRCSLSEWRRGSGSAASPWASCCVPSFSLTATEGITLRMCWREENSCPRSVPLCCQRTRVALKKLLMIRGHDHYN